ncbi:Plasma kallikrein [Halotydeus destructor]|nr:Plasma kallikrein [Halotydeus destructor]
MLPFLLISWLLCQAPDFTECSTELCGTTREVMPRSRIVGGRRALEGEFPHQVSLQFWQQPGSHFCGGVIISDRWILTAAHCLVRWMDKTLMAIGGSNSRRFYRSTMFKVSKSIVHRDYNTTTLENDIALLKTSEPMPLYSKNTSSQLDINNICLPDPYEQFFGKAILTGYGMTSERGSTSSQLLTVELDIQPRMVCRDLYSGRYSFNAMMCAGHQDGGKDSCQGDSGGPLFQKRYGGSYVLVGLTSFGNGCARANTPGVYTQVSSFLNWIEQQTAAN